MCVPFVPPPSGTAQRLPSMRNPVPQSRMNCVPSGATNSRHGVSPPYRQVAGSTVGVEPRTPQKLSLAMGTVISPVFYFLFGNASRDCTRSRASSWWQSLYTPSIAPAQLVVIVPNKPKPSLHAVPRLRTISSWLLIPAPPAHPAILARYRIILTAIRPATPTVVIAMLTATPATRTPLCAPPSSPGPWLPPSAWSSRQSLAVSSAAASPSSTPPP